MSVPLTRVTVTLPPDLVTAADRVARRRGASRSAVVVEALRTHLAEHPGRVAEPRLGTPFAMSDQALIEELRRRLGASGAAPDAGFGGPQLAAARLRYDRGQLAALCRRHHIVKLSLFGSVLMDEFDPASDVDVLVEFEPGHTPGLGITDIEDDLSALFGGRPVDLVTERSLHRLIRDRVLAGAAVQFAA